MAEIRICGKKSILDRSIGGTFDLPMLYGLASSIAIGKELGAYLAWLELRADGLISMPANWAAVRRVAEALIKKKKLTSSEAKGLVYDTWKHIYTLLQGTGDIASISAMRAAFQEYANTAADDMLGCPEGKFLRSVAGASTDGK